MAGSLAHSCWHSRHCKASPRPSLPLPRTTRIGTSSLLHTGHDGVIRGSSTSPTSHGLATGELPRVFCNGTDTLRSEQAGSRRPTGQTGQPTDHGSASRRPHFAAARQPPESTSSRLFIPVVRVPGYQGCQRGLAEVHGSPCRVHLGHSEVSQNGHVAPFR